MTSAATIAKAVVIAAVVSVICLLPPVAHFVTGPLGPAIGGYIAGSRARLSDGQAALLGAILGLLVGLPAPLAIAELDIGPALSPVALIFFGGLGAIYVGVLSGLAASFGGRSARHEDEERRSGSTRVESERMQEE